MQIDDSNLGAVFDLLEAGFPTRSRAFWERGIARLQSLTAHARDGEPIGYVLETKGKIVGVGLTAISDRPLIGHTACARASACSETRTHRYINLASWYIAPEHRWRMPILLKKMLNDKAAIYTDLTPTDAVQPILTTLGFEPINGGVKVINTAIAACGAHRDAIVQEWNSDTTSQDRHVHDRDTTARRDIIDAHCDLGCIAFEVLTPGGSALVALKPTKVKQLRAAQVVLSTDNNVLETALASISRALVARGYLALIMDIAPDRPETSTLSQLALPKRRKRFIKNAKPNGGTDYAYSELVLFDL
ncbi:MAG: hypothetical protein AAFY64_01580 [Pseudomonadota bacterium]